MEALALKYRPRNFDDLVGQRSVHGVLRQMVAKNAVPAALLFAGPRGVGKTTTLRILAASLNCEGNPVPCGHCVSCKSTFDGTSLDLREIDAASHGLVDDIRTLRQEVLYATGGGWRVIGLDEAHSMSRAAFNAALKMIEEPPPNTVFVLLTTEPTKIPDTIWSRCVPFPFRAVSIADIIERLSHICRQEHLTVEPALLARIAEHAAGGMRDAVMTLDQITRAGITTLAAYNDLTGDTDYAPVLLSAIASGDLAATFAGLDAQLARTGDPGTVADALTDTLRDTLVLNAGGDLHHQGDALTQRQQLAARIPTSQAVAALGILWTLKTRVRPTENPRTSLDLAVVMLSELFARHTRSATPTSATATPAAAAPAPRQAGNPSTASIAAAVAPTRRLSLAEMAAIRQQRPGTAR